MNFIRYALILSLVSTSLQAVESISDAQAFQSKIQAGNAVVDFWAPWCGPCKRYGPIFEAVAGNQLFAGTVTFIKVNIDQAKAISNQYAVRSIPTTVFFKDGREIQRFSGATDATSLTNRIKGLFGL